MILFSQYSEITFIGISNDLRFTEKLDARVKSSLGEEEIICVPPLDELEYVMRNYVSSILESYWSDSPRAIETIEQYNKDINQTSLIKFINTFDESV